ncbi:MAG: hypothetical protein ABL903_18675 [Methylococcales bacterium]
MAESLFVLVIIFTAYVFYSRANEAQATTTSEVPEQPPAKSVAEKAIQPTAVKPEIAASPKPKPKSSAKAKAPTPSAPKSSPIKATPPKSVPKVTGKQTAPTNAKKVVPAQITPNTNLGKISLKNPVTGEIDAPHSNYRFTKRWIKEALVTEGLLDKVYKNTELDGAVEERIKAAVSKLEAMDNYRA